MCAEDWRGAEPWRRIPPHGDAELDAAMSTITCRGQRRTAKARLGAVGPTKAARFRRQAAELYDRVVLGPAAPPTHLQPGRGDVAPHWGSGHFQMQPNGPESTLQKVVSIAPTLVRSDRWVECQTEAFLSFGHRIDQRSPMRY